MTDLPTIMSYPLYRIQYDSGTYIDALIKTAAEEGRPNIEQAINGTYFVGKTQDLFQGRTYQSSKVKKREFEAITQNHVLAAIPTFSHNLLAGASHMFPQEQRIEATIAAIDAARSQGFVTSFLGVLSLSAKGIRVYNEISQEKEQYQ